MFDEEIIEVIFLKKECDMAIVSYNNSIKKIKREFIYETLECLTYGEKFFIERSRVEEPCLNYNFFI